MRRPLRKGRTAEASRRSSTGMPDVKRPAPGSVGRFVDGRSCKAPPGIWSLYADQAGIASLPVDTAGVRSSRRRILPIGVFGSGSVRNSTIRGTL